MTSTCLLMLPGSPRRSSTRAVQCDGKPAPTAWPSFAGSLHQHVEQLSHRPIESFVSPGAARAMPLLGLGRSGVHPSSCSIIRGTHPRHRRIGDRLWLSSIRRPERRPPQSGERQTLQTDRNRSDHPNWVCRTSFRMQEICPSPPRRVARSRCMCQCAESANGFLDRQASERFALGPRCNIELPDLLRPTQYFGDWRLKNWIRPAVHRDGVDFRCIRVGDCIASPFGPSWGGSAQRPDGLLHVKAECHTLLGQPVQPAQPVVCARLFASAWHISVPRE